MAMEKLTKIGHVSTIIVLINLGTLLVSMACPSCPSPDLPPVHPRQPRPPAPKPPVIPPPPPTVIKPPTVPKPPSGTPCPPPPAPPKARDTCPIDALKLGACVDVLGGLIKIGIGAGSKETCCPLLSGLVDLDAALCLCTAIEAKLLNIGIFLPIALEVLIECGKTPPSGFQCPA